jgi:DNA-binding transcriptional MerR regulator
MRRAGGRRFYRPEDVRLLKALRNLLHEERRRIGDLQNLSRADLLALSSDNLPKAAASRGSARNLHGLQSALAAAISAKQRLDGLLATAGR